LPDAYVRLTVYAGQNKSEYSLLVREYQPYPEKKYREGFRLGISRFRQNEFSFFCRLKICDRMLYELALKEAREAGFDEAIILNSRGYISEASRSNIFLSRKKELFTPALSCGCLDGITRRVILDLARRYKVKSNEGNFTLKDLEEAEGAFLTNSLIGLMPLKDKCAGLTRFFLKKYRCLLK
jgi:branched-subunit amino acid aminotransferase/4-amino-4-deoxychorismate lyase